jgi:hypothetical protein
MQTDEDFETQMWSIANYAKGAAEAARKGLAIAGKGLAAAGKAAQKGLEVAYAEGKKTVAALKEAHKTYQQHRRDSQNSAEQGDLHPDRQQSERHLQEALQEVKRANAELAKVNKSELSDEQQQQLAEVQKDAEVSTLVAELIAQLAQNAG